MAALLEPPLEELDKELTRLRHQVAHADVVSLHSSPDLRERSAVLKAFTYVWLGAILERSLRACLHIILTELNSRAIPCVNLRASLFSLLCEPDLNSIRDRRRQKTWNSRAGMFASVSSASAAEFNTQLLPLDARTPRAEHFDNVWIVFGFSGNSLPGSAHRLALDSLAEGRNNIAHGIVDPVIFGRARATSDLFMLGERVEQSIYHLAEAGERYLLTREYCK